MSERERWEAGVKDWPERVNLVGPPNWLVSENRRGKEEIQITVQRLREELGIGPVRQLNLRAKQDG